MKTKLNLLILPIIIGLSAQLAITGNATAQGIKQPGSQAIPLGEVNPEMMRNMTPEQRQQYIQKMRNKGLGKGRMQSPGMMPPGKLKNMTPEQRQQYFQQMRQRGLNPEKMRDMTPQQRQQYMEQMRRQRNAPAMQNGMPAESTN